MNAEAMLLDDEGMRNFIINGYTVVRMDFPPEFHEAIYQKTSKLFAEDGNPGNDLTRKVPEVLQVWEHPSVRGALASILGPNYLMHPHRHCHQNLPGTDEQDFHLDSYEADENVRHHRCRWVLAMYYPQDVTLDMGPTALLKGSHYLNEQPDRSPEAALPFLGEAGSVMIIHYEAWHRAMSNQSVRQRFMMKFLFFRAEEPSRPSWDCQESFESNGEPGSQELYDSVWNWNCGNDVAHRENASKADINEWLEELNNSTESTRLAAAYKLGRSGAAAMPGLMDTLRSESAAKCQSNLERRHTNASQLYSTYALSAIGSPAVPNLVEALEEPDWWVRSAAADTLGDIGFASEMAVQKLTDCLCDPSEWVRRNAAEALGTIGSSAQPAIPELMKAMDDENRYVRLNALLSLVRIERPARSCIPALEKALSHEEYYIRGLTVDALKRAGIEVQ